MKSKANYISHTVIGNVQIEKALPTIASRQLASGSPHKENHHQGGGISAYLHSNKKPGAPHARYSSLRNQLKGNFVSNYLQTSTSVTARGCLLPIQVSIGTIVTMGESRRDG